MANKNTTYVDGNALVRNFSKLGKYQKAHSTSYNLQKSKEGYIITVCEREEKSNEERTSSLQCEMSEKEATYILYVLYENAVPITHWQDIVKDLLSL